MPRTKEEMLGNLGKYLTDGGLAAAERMLEDRCIDATAEVVAIIAILRNLSESTLDHANDEHDDGFELSAEASRDRADEYFRLSEAIIRELR